MTKKYISPEHAIRDIFYKQPIAESKLEEDQINVLDEQSKKKPEEQDNLAQDAVDFGLDIAPFVGTARSGIRAVDNFNKGDYLGAAGEGIMTGIGAAGDAATVLSGGLLAAPKTAIMAGIRGVGNLVKGAGKVLKIGDKAADATKAADKAADATKAADKAADATKASRSRGSFGRNAFRVFRAASASGDSGGSSIKTPGQNSSAGSISGSENSNYLHMPKPRIVGENTTYDERKSIENVPRPKSDRNKSMTRNQEIKKKIIDENVKKKLIIKDAVKNGKDKNYSVEINPEYKHEKLSD